MSRMNGLQYSKTNQVFSVIFSVIVLAVLVFLVIKGGQWWAITACLLLLVLGSVVFVFSRKAER